MTDYCGLIRELDCLRCVEQTLITSLTLIIYIQIQLKIVYMQYKLKRMSSHYILFEPLTCLPLLCMYIFLCASQ